MPGKQLRVVEHDEATGEWKAVIHSEGGKQMSNPEGGKKSMMKKLQTFFEDDLLTPIAKAEADDNGEEDASLTASLMILLLLVAVVASVLSFTVDSAGLAIGAWKGRLAAIHGPFTAEVSADIFLIILARLCVQVAPASAGSGIPEVKCILTGGSLSQFLILPVLVAKCVGLICAVGAGLPLGKEGPFVHIAACCGAQLLKLKVFKGLHGKRDAAEKVLLCAVSVGVGATFSAPIGGMLFALELMMPHIYDLSSYRACFAASAMGSMVYQLLKLARSAARPGAVALTPLINSNVAAENSRTASAEASFLFTCVIVGCISGTLGGLFVRFHQKAMGGVKIARGMGPPPKPQSKKASLLGKPPKPSKKMFGGPSLLRDLVLCVALAVAGAALKTYAHQVSFIGTTGGALFGMGGPPMITELFNTESQHLEIGVLAAVFLIKWVHSAVAISMPVPTGCVAPCLVLGALFGRLCGLGMPEFMWRQFATDETYYSYVARFAIVGAAAFTASVCQTLSIVVTIFELIAVPGFVLPLILGTLAGVMASQQIAPSIYDSILMAKGLPCLPALSANHKGHMQVRSCMHDDVKAFAIQRHTSRNEVKMIRRNLLKKGWSAGVSLTIPIVELIGSKYVLVGAIDDESIDKVISPSQPASLLDEDILEVFALQDLLVTPLRIDAHESLQDVYIEAQTMHYDRTMFVVDDGFFIGLLTLKDLFLLR